LDREAAPRKIDSRALASVANLQATSRPYP